MLGTESLELVTLSYLQGESQVFVFYLLVEVGLLSLYEHRFFELHLVLISSCRVQDLEQDLCNIAHDLNSTAISKRVTLKMTDVPSKHVW